MSLERALAAMRATEGWLTEVEATALYGLTVSVLEAGPAPIVEVGSWKGRSTVVLATAAMSQRHRDWWAEPLVHAVDTFEGSPEQWARNKGQKFSLYPAFEANLAKAGVSACVATWRGRSVEVARQWHGPVGLLFLDGDHAYESVAADVEAWAPHLRAGGYLAMHDTGGQKPGPTRLYRELLERPDWTPAGQHGGLGVLRKALRPT